MIRTWTRGLNKREVAHAMGLSYSTTWWVIGRFNAEGMKAMAPHSRGRRVGAKRVLTPKQESHFQKLIGDQRPT